MISVLIFTLKNKSHHHQIIIAGRFRSCRILSHHLCHCQHSDVARNDASNEKGRGRGGWGVRRFGTLDWIGDGAKAQLLKIHNRSVSTPTSPVAPHKRLICGHQPKYHRLPILPILYSILPPPASSFFNAFRVSVRFRGDTIALYAVA